jgi:hypothetical protein
MHQHWYEKDTHAPHIVSDRQEPHTVLYAPCPWMKKVEQTCIRTGTREPEQTCIRSGTREPEHALGLVHGA